MAEPGSGAAPASPVRRPVAVLAVGVGLAVVTLVAAVAARVDWRSFVDSYGLTNLVIGSGFFASGVTISWFRTRHVVGLLLQGSGLAYLLSAAATMLALLGLGSDWPEPVIRTLSTVSTGAWQVGLGWLLPLALLRYPDGRLPGRNWRVVVWLLLVAGGYQIVTGVLSDGSSFSDAPQARSILSVGLEPPDVVNEAMGWLYTLGTLAVMGSLVVRYVRGDEQVKRQLLWLILAVVGVVVVNAQRFVSAEGPILLLLSFLFIPAAIAIAIVRYELFDIRLVLSRTLLYTLMVSLIIAAYAGIVAGFSLLVPHDAQRRVAIGAAIVVAIAFNPLRLALQRLLDRAFYGTRSDPLGTVARVGRGFRHDDLAAVLEGTRSALHLPWLGLRRDGDTGPVVEAGTPDGSPGVELPLTYRGAIEGALLVGLRRGESRLHDTDRRTLDLIATPLAVALRATALSEEVTRARAATVESAAVERVRLQRELHDGLGPTLTSVAFRADAASNLLRTDTDQAERLLDEVRSDLRSAIESVRRVVYGLRPIELDDLGLAGALRQKVAALAHGDRRVLAVHLAVPDPLPPLSPAIELAAYRIATEALTNILRHSGARECRISVQTGEELIITVIDDGEPPARWRPGVGIRSMAERAEELGGSARAGPVARGWEVKARLPLTRLAPT